MKLLEISLAWYKKLRHSLVIPCVLKEVFFSLGLWKAPNVAS